MDLKPRSIADLLVNVHDRYAALARARCLEIRLGPRIFDIPKLIFDRALLDLQFSNIVDNAIKYSFGGKRDRRTGECETTRQIDVDGKFDGNILTVTVTNYGIAISTEEAATGSIFDLYVRSRNRDKKRQVETSGIGCFVAREIARAHRGDITVTVTNRSDRPPNAPDDWVEAGRVAFTVTLPLSRDT